MTPDLTLKRGDAGRVITGTFTDENGAAINCTGSSNRKIMMRRLGVAALKINSTFTFTNEASGAWSYTMQAADVDTVGRYFLEHEVTLPGPQTLTFPVDRAKPYLVVLIQQDLG